jgi:pteridine reductase
LAKELAPEVRVNGVSPGVILWPENQSLELGEEIVMRIPLQRQGSVDDIAETVLFLSKNAGYITGQVIAVDGGKSLV